MFHPQLGGSNPIDWPICVCACGMGRSGQPVVVVVVVVVYDDDDDDGIPIHARENSYISSFHQSENACRYIT